MRKKWIGASVAIAALVVSACSASKSTTTTQAAPRTGYLAVADTKAPAGGALKMEVAQDVVEATGLDPQTAQLAASWQLMSMVYETLVSVGPDFAIKPGLASSWDEKTPTEYVFHLRTDVRFTNGRAMTADDVVGSLQRLLASTSIWRGQLGPVKSVSKLDASTVKVDLSTPYTPFLAALAQVNAAVLPMAEVNAKSVDLTKTMLGTGPFEVTSHRQDISWTFKRNNNYWVKDKPALAEIDVKVVAQEATRIADLRSGTADVAPLDNIDSPRLLQGVPNVRVLTQASTNFYYIILNSQRPNSKLSDQRVRTALNIALNRKQLNEVAMGGLSKPTGVVPLGLPDSCDPASLPSATAGLDKARQLLKDAGAEKLTIGLAIYNTEPAVAQLAQVVQQELQAIGVTVKISNMDLGAFGKAYIATPANFDAALSWFAGYADPGMVVRWWNPDLAGFSKGFMGNDPEQDKFITAAQQQEGAARVNALKDLCARVDHNAEMTPLVTRPAIIGYRTDHLSPSFYAAEGYSDFWRLIADFRSLSSR